MTRELSINEHGAANDYRRVAGEAAAESEGFSLAVCVLKAVGGGLSEETREEIFSAIRKHQGTSEPLGRASRLAMLHSLGQTEELIAAYAERADSMAQDAEKTAGEVEAHGLPLSSE